MKKIFLLLLIAGLAGFGLFFWWENGLRPVDSGDDTQKSFTIRPGEGTREITERLKEQGLIKDPIVFFLLVKQAGVDGKIQAGEFYLSPSMRAAEILQRIQIGKLDLTVTIPEGKRADEIADIFSEKMPQFEPAWREELNKHEGYLFPDTYTFARESSIDQIIAMMKSNFDLKYEDVSPSVDLSKPEIVILASLIEREAKLTQDRPMVSSVIHNRLKEGMKLDIDATVQYALGYDVTERRWWKRELTYDDLEIDSPYNTYKNSGLPPEPICNPGLASIQAAANPADSEYLYYISDKEGNNHYAKTLGEHNQNIKKYLE